MKNVIKHLIFLFATVVLFGFGGDAYAVDEVVDVVSLNISGDNMVFDESNVYPGWSDSKTIVVENQSTESAAELYIDFKGAKDDKLTEVLDIFVIKISDDSYLVGGENDRHTLKEADMSSPLFMGMLGIGESEEYKINVKLDEERGGEYQGDEASFDTSFALSGRMATGATEAQIFTEQKRAVTKEAPKEPEVKSVTMVNIGEPVNGRVAGAAACRSWPLWSWVVMMILYAGIAYLVGKRARSVSESMQNVLWQSLILLGAFGLWYFFDMCRTYDWVPFAISVVGVIFVLISFQKTIGKKATVKTPKKAPKKKSARGPKIT